MTVNSMQATLTAWNTTATYADRVFLTVLIAILLSSLYAMALCVMAAIESRNRNR